MELTFIGYNHTHDVDFNINRPLGSGDYLALIVKSPAVFTINGRDLHTPPNIFSCIQRMLPNTIVLMAKYLPMTLCTWIFLPPMRNISGI